MKFNFKYKKTEATVWRQFTRHGDAIFLSLGKEIRIGVLSAATLSVTCPDSAAAMMAMNHQHKADAEQTCTLAADSDDEPIDLSALQHGDLLFNVVSPSRDGIAKAIVTVTEGIDLQKISHVAIVCKEVDGQLYALEATTQNGVCLTPINSFLLHSDHTPTGEPLVLLGRLKDPSNVAASVEKAKTYLGRPYDFLYEPSDSAIYCSELVHYSYFGSTGEELFPQQPMSFHDESGQITQFWIDHYRKWNRTVPEGEPGTNPGGISRSDNIVIVGKFFREGKAAYTMQLDDAEVVGTRAPLPSDKAVRLVQIITRKEIEASSANSVNDLLKLAAGVDVRQRGGFGIQTDIGVNGGTEDQLTILLNGINISNPHTGHLAADFPVNTDDIERIEVIEGGASRVYGSQAFAGAINIVTRSEQQSNVGFHAQGGSYGTMGVNGHLAFKSTSFSNRVSGGYAQSDGGTHNDDFNKGNAYWNGKYQSPLFDATVQAGFSTMNYGANTFYGTGSDSQYEQGRRYLVAVQSEYKGKVHVPVQAYWNRSLDHYVWWRARPEDYQNFHQTNVYGANLNAYTTWALGKSAVGIEFRQENILSTSLGKEIAEKDRHKYKVPGRDEYYNYKDGRSNIGVYLEHDLLFHHVTVSLGALANHNTAVSRGFKFYPGIDLSWRMTEGMKVFASFNKSLRTPTYTDLYYNGPGLAGNRQLKPERSTDWHIGFSYASPFISAQLKGFYRNGTDMIDWVKYAGTTVYTTANSDINNIGAEALVGFRFTDVWGKESILQRLTISYCYNYKYRKNEEQAAQANYASNLTFLRHKLVTSFHHRILEKLSAQWDFTLKNREGEFDNAHTGERQSFGTFANLDVKLQWIDTNYTIYAQANNLTNHPYYDFANIQQPGIWLMGGVKIHFNL